MKKLFLLGALALSYWTSGQSYFSIGTDVSGDDHSFGLDATDLAYDVSPGDDSLYIKITHANPRQADFGFALAIDTNLNTTDGRPVSQTNIQNNSPNNSMNYDILLFAYQNGFFPSVFTEAREGSTGNIINLDFQLDTVDPYYSVFRIALADIGGNLDLNLIGFTGSFDISASGPSDAIPNSTYSEIRVFTIGQPEPETAPGFSAYPNPARVSVQVEGVEDGEHILIRDVSGKIVQHLEVINRKIELPLPLDGLYFLQEAEGHNVLKMHFTP
ncbi:MAG: hypothetical protein ACPF9D_03795 [Owenweeksia sp.]